MAGTLQLSDYKLTFDALDPFTSSPDGSTGWQTTFYFGGRSLSSNGEQEYYSDPSAGMNPFDMQNGILDITAAPGDNPAHLPYNSGLITTEGSFSQTYGYFEMRAKLPEGQGMWPAFWLLPTDKSWPPEIDVMEAFGAPNGHGEGGADQVHYGAISSDGSQSGGNWATVPSDIYADYHTYGVDWQRDYITWYFDGQQVGQMATPSDMNKPMYMLANLAVGGNWPGAPAGESGHMDIDYIHAYSNDPHAQAVASPQILSATASASAAAPGPDTLVLHVAEDAFGGDAQFTVSVDGRQVGGIGTATASHAQGQWQDVTLTGNFAGAGAVAVTFINDASDGTLMADRNLYVGGIELNGQHVAGNLASNTADAGGLGAQYDPNAAVLLTNGTAVFDVQHLNASEYWHRA